MDISLGRVIEAARERQATLTSEVAGYVILLAAQQLGAERSSVSAESVVLDETGSVRVRRDAAASEIDVEASLRSLLGALIQLCSTPPPAILAVTERVASGDLRGLVAEMSAALIPINHAAAHRALARLYREARRAQGHAADNSLPPIAEHGAARQGEPGTVAAGELDIFDIDVVIDAGETEPVPAPVVVAQPAADVAPDPAAPPPATGISFGPPRIEDFAPLLVHEPLRPRRPRPAEARSDVEHLLEAYLAQSRSIEHMLGVLRDMIGLDARPGLESRPECDPAGAVPR